MRISFLNFQWIYFLLWYILLFLIQFLVLIIILIEIHDLRCLYKICLHLICQSDLIILNLLNLFLILYMFRPLLPLIFLTINRRVCLQIYYLIRSSFTNGIYLSKMNNLRFLLTVIVNLILNVLKLPIIIEVWIISYALYVILILYRRLS